MYINSFGYLLICNRLYLQLKLLFLKLKLFLSAHFFSLFFDLERLIKIGIVIVAFILNDCVSFVILVLYGYFNFIFSLARYVRKHVLLKSISIIGRLLAMIEISVNSFKYGVGSSSVSYWLMENLF